MINMVSLPAWTWPDSFLPQSQQRNTQFKSYLKACAYQVPQQYISSESYHKRPTTLSDLTSQCQAEAWVFLLCLFLFSDPPLLA